MKTYSEISIKPRSETPMKRADVEHTQDRIHFSFPEKYVEDILDFGKMRFKPNRVNNIIMDGHLLSVKNYMSLIEGEVESLHTAICATGKDLVPFAYDTKGMMFCFDRHSKSIFVYNRHTRHKMKIAQTYSEFKSLIKFIEY